ncbi:uncharacterized protein HD556DRAFT_1438739 [Suillus plorans]|uniref:Uncharacterized protein n=1 Tax=Suillus plorans TaxID=116603 RepID=A0A9P7DQM4_9AGAM|nr:uncharacterized protein HD556DRAFT_1438739 [Suillus plorans]KAG1800739.1 hypothetical protein HD556DRAFT_1438739 [Suillus plorans]
MEDYQDMLYELLPFPETGDLETETQAGPSHGYRTTVEDAEEDDELRNEVDERVKEENTTAGASIRLVETLHECWRRNFGPEKDRNGDINMLDISSELEAEDGKFAPFNSELDWRIARWVIQDGIGHKSFDRLMVIPGVVDKLGLSFHNIRELHQVVDGVPPRAQWKTRQLWYRSNPEDKHTIYYRNPCEVTQSLLGNPAFANEAPSRRSVATWISMGLAIEEAQIALLIEVRRIGRRTTETQRLDIAWKCDRLQGQIDGFTQSALMHLGEGFDADDDPDNLNIDILDDLDDDPEDFTRTSDDTWTNSPQLTVIPLPSSLGVDRCRRFMAEDLIPLVMSLCEGQANDALHNLRIHLCNKAILFRTTVRQAKSQALKTRAWSQTQKQMMKLEPGQDQLQKYKPLLHDQKISTAVGDPNARGQRNESLTWFWSVKVELGGPDQLWNEEFYRVPWLRAKALQD